MSISSRKFHWALGAVALPALFMFVLIAQAQTPQGTPPRTLQPSSPGRPLPAPGATLPDYQAFRPITPGNIPRLTTDQDVANWLQIANDGELQMAKLAQEKSQNSLVRQFAERMIRDHSQLLDQLKPFEVPVAAQQPQPPNNAAPISPDTTANIARPEGPANAGRATIAGTPTTPAAPGTAGTPVRAPDIGSVPTPGSAPNSATVPTPGGLPVPGTIPPTAPPHVFANGQPPAGPVAPPSAAPAIAASPVSPGLDFLHAMRQINAQSLAASRKQWDTMRPADADIAYIGQQIVAHEQYLDTSTVLRQYASLRLKSLIDQGMVTARSHLTEAKDIMRDLSGKNYSEGRTDPNAK